MTVFVLVHGSWHDGSLWEPVANHLRAQGMTVHCPTIAGHGPNADRHVNHAECTQSITNYILEHDLKDIVLLGHSYGGTIISKVAEVIPERIKRLIYWNAFVLQDGENMFDNMPDAYYELFNSLAAASGDNTVLSMMLMKIWHSKHIKCSLQSLASLFTIGWI